MKKKFGKAASNCYMQLSTSMFMKQKNVGLANYRVSFKCKQQHIMFMKQQTRDLLLKIAEVV